MWDRVGDGNVLEATGINLVIVIWITPTAKAVKGGVGKDGGMIEIRGVYFCVS